MLKHTLTRTPVHSWEKKLKKLKKWGETQTATNRITELTYFEWPTRSLQQPRPGSSSEPQKYPCCSKSTCSSASEPLSAKTLERKRERDHFDGKTKKESEREKERRKKADFQASEASNDPEPKNKNFRRPKEKKSGREKQKWKKGLLAWEHYEMNSMATGR